MEGPRKSDESEPMTNALQQKISSLNLKNFEDDGRLYVSKHTYPEQILQVNLDGESPQCNESEEAQAYGTGFALEIKLVMNYFHGAEGKKIGRMMENADESLNLCRGGCSGRCKCL